MKTKKICTVIASSLMLATIIAGNLPANANEMTPEDTSYSWAKIVNSSNDLHTLVEDCIDEDEEDGSIDNPELQDIIDIMAIARGSYGERSFGELCEFLSKAAGFTPTTTEVVNQSKYSIVLRELTEVQKVEAGLKERLEEARKQIESAAQLKAAEHLADNVANLERVDPTLYALDPDQADETNFLDEYKNDYLTNQFPRDIAALQESIPWYVAPVTNDGSVLLDPDAHYVLDTETGMITATVGNRTQIVSVNRAKKITTEYRDRTTVTSNIIKVSDKKWLETSRKAIKSLSYYNKRLATYLKNLNAELTARVEYFIEAKMDTNESRYKVYEKVMNPSDYQKNVLVPMEDMERVIDDFNTLREALDGFVETTLPPTGTESEIKKKAPTPGTFDTTGSPFRGMEDGVAEAIQYMDENVFIRGAAAYEGFLIPSAQATAYMNEKAPEVATALAKGIRISTLPSNHHRMPNWVKERAAIMAGGTYVHPTQAASVKYSVTQLQLAWENMVAIEDAAQATIADIIKADKNKLIPDPKKHMVGIDRARSNVDAALSTLQAKIAGSLKNPARVVGRPTVAPQCLDLSFADVIWDSCRSKVGTKGGPLGLPLIVEVSNNREDFDSEIYDRVQRLRASLPENSSNIEDIEDILNMEVSILNGDLTLKEMFVCNGGITEEEIACVTEMRLQEKESD